MSHSTLAELTIASKDGDWGVDEDVDGHSRYAIIRGTDFEQVAVGRIGDVPMRYLADRTSERRTLAAGDVLIETAGGSPRRPTGRTMLVTQQILDLFDSPVSCASFARFLRFDREIADPRYMYWSLQELYRSGVLETYQVQHTGVARFQYTSFANAHRFSLPPLPEQQAIAEVLGALDDKIAANTRLAATADELASTIVRAALTAERIALTELAMIVMGSSPRGEELNESNQGIPFYQGVRDFGIRFPTRRVFTTAPVRLAAAGDLLVSVRAPVGDVNWAEEDSCIGRGLAAVRSRLEHQATLFHQLRADNAAWLPFQSEGTVFASINKAQLHGLELRSVDPAKEYAVEAEVAAIESHIRVLLQENRTLAATRDALLPKLMSGALRVKDAENAVSEVA